MATANDPISDMLARIAMRRWLVTSTAASGEHAQASGCRNPKQKATWPTSVRRWGPKKHNTLTIVLKYGGGGDKVSAFQGMRRVSRPGRRVYVRHDQIPRVLSGLGVSILSTSHGLMTDREARQKKVGGELLCEVW